MVTETISKKDAAKRQLETAIRLYIDDNDAVSIHTLSAAAFEITRDFRKDMAAVNQANGAVVQLMNTKRFLKNDKENAKTNRDSLFKIVRDYQKNVKHAGKNRQRMIDAINSLKTAIQSLFTNLSKEQTEGFSESLISILSSAEKELIDVRDPIESIVEHLISTDYFKPDMKSSVIAAIREPQNFFKHGENDPHKTLDFNHNHSQLFLYITCDFFIDVFAEYYNLLLSAYMAWFKKQNPNYFTSELDQWLIEYGIKSGVSTNKKDFFDNLKEH